MIGAIVKFQSFSILLPSGWLFGAAAMACREIAIDIY